MLMKPLMNSLSFVIFNKDRSKFLTVKRPLDEKDHPGTWGLPAGSVKKGESFEDALLRAGKQKLGVQLKLVRLINQGTIERDTYLLFMKMFEVEIIAGEPEVPQPVEGMTQYTEWRWGIADDLIAAAKVGALCCQLFLKSSDSSRKK